MVGHLSEGGGLGFLVHDDLVWICRDSIKQESSVCDVFLSHTDKRNTGTHQNTYTSFLFPLIPVSMSVSLSICAKQRYQAQTEKPRAQ